MDLINDLLRFVHLGDTGAFYKAKQKTRTAIHIRTNLEFIKTSVESIASTNSGGNGGGDRNRNMEDPLWPLTLVKKVLNSKTLPSNNDAILVLAYCTTFITNEKLRHEIYAAIPDILPKAEDLFLFIKYSSTLHEGKGFGRGLRAAISKWYNKKTPLELADMIGRNRSHNGWSHADIITLSHTVFTEIEKKAIKGAAFKRGYQLIRRQAQLPPRDDFPGLIRLCNIARLKVCEDEEHAANMIKLHSFKLENVPAHLMKSSHIWETLLPTLTYNQLIMQLPFLNDVTLLKPTESFAKKYCAVLGNANLLAESKIHPIQLLITMRGHESQIRYEEHVKESHRIKQLKTKKIEKNPHVLKRLQTAINNSFGHTARTGLRYYITIDLRKTAFEKPVFGLCKKISNVDVSILMALTIYKREKDVTVMAFSETANQLITIPFTKEMTHEKAVQLCKEQSKRNTVQNLALPLTIAQRDKNKCDIFLTFVDSIKRSVPNGQPPLQQYKNYKKHFNLKQLKYIFFNLSRHGIDLNIDSNNAATKGMLEIVGFNAKVPTIIEAFAKNQFY